MRRIYYYVRLMNVLLYHMGEDVHATRAWVVKMSECAGVLLLFFAAVYAVMHQATLAAFVVLLLGIFFFFIFTVMPPVAHRIYKQRRFASRSAS